MMNDVMRIIKEMNLALLIKYLTILAKLFSIRKGQAEELRTRLKKLSFE